MGENIHKGHRVRMKEQFLNSGLSHFNDHQILELLLFYAIPQKDTNELAHNLIRHFGSFHNVFAARFDDLVKVPGISTHAATLIKMIPQLCTALATKKTMGRALRDPEVIAEFFETQFLGVTNEKILLACLDDQMRLLDLSLISDGDIGSVSFDIRKLINQVIRVNSSQIIIAHNHPAGSCKPSDPDMMATEKLRKSFAAFGITLCDHVVVGNDGSAFVISKRYVPIYCRLPVEKRHR